MTDEVTKGYEDRLDRLRWVVRSTDAFTALERADLWRLLVLNNAYESREFLEGNAMAFVEGYVLRAIKTLRNSDPKFAELYRKAHEVMTPKQVWGVASALKIVMEYVDVSEPWELRIK